MLDETTEQVPVTALSEESSKAAVGLSQRRKWVAAVAVAAVLLTGSGIVASLVVKSPAQAAAEAGPPPPDVLTAPVESRVLKDTVVMRGTVVAGQSVEVAPSGGDAEGGTGPVVTKVPLRAGSKVNEGKVLLEISGRPVFVLKGQLPVYRDLKPGDTGDDVKQLQSALAGRGHSTGSDRSGTFGSGTQAALAAFYSSIGYTPRSADPAGEETVRAAEEAETQAERALQDARDAGAPSGSGEEGSAEPSSRTVERAEEDLAAARERLAEAKAAAGPMLPAGEVVYVSSFPARVAEVTGVLGAKVTGTVMTLSTGELVIHGYLQEQQKGLVRADQDVEVLSETTGKNVSASVVSVADTPAAANQDQGGEAEGQGDPAAGGASGPQGYLMVVKPDKALPSELEGADVRLTVEAASTEGEALVVPVSAISSGADGKTSVTVREKDGRRRVEVGVGTSGDGFVEVKPLGGGSLTEQDEVITGVQSEQAEPGGDDAQ